MRAAVTLRFYGRSDWVICLLGMTICRADGSGRQPVDIHHGLGERLRGFLR